MQALPLFGNRCHASAIAASPFGAASKSRGSRVDGVVDFDGNFDFDFDFDFDAFDDDDDDVRFAVPSPARAAQEKTRARATGTMRIAPL